MASSRLCVTVTGATTAELRNRRDAAARADLVELRLDTVRDPNAAGALAGRQCPVIVTCRPVWEGGHFSGSEEERQRILLEAWDLGADYIDVEWQAPLDALMAHTAGRRVLLSLHDFDGVPADLPARAQAMRTRGAEGIKLAVTPRTLSDCLRLREIPSQPSAPGVVVVLGMGPRGAPTRILPSRFGSAWTYAGPLREVGQLDADTLLDGFHFKSLNDHTSIYGIVGGSVAHSVSPSMHNAAFTATGIDAVYVPLPAVDADDFIRFGRSIGIKGASVTIPHKVSLFNRMDDLDPVAQQVGAVNTIRVAEGRWVGANTDVRAFLEPLRRRVALRGLRASLLGAGGAARAVAIALAPTGCSLRVHARSRAKAEEVASIASAAVGPWPPEPGSWDLLVNATPVGTYPHVDETPVPKERLTGRYVYDLVYNPPASRLLRDAAERGCDTIGGLEMLVAQAAEQYRWWTGAPAPVEVMRKAAVTRLAEFASDEHYVI